MRYTTQANLPLLYFANFAYFKIASSVYIYIYVVLLHLPSYHRLYSLS